MTFEEYKEPLAYEIAFFLQGLSNPKYPIDKIGQLTIELTEKFRVLAIIILLTKGNNNVFYHNLIRSSKTREAYLLKLRNSTLQNDHHYASGRYEPLVDAIAANDFQLAKSIAALSPKDWKVGHEYEDDYCYAQILHRLIQDIVPENEISEYIDQFKNYLEGEPNARLEVCESLLKRDQHDFDDAFESLILERELKISKDKERGQIENPLVMAQRQIFVEGLAILRLAEKRGLQTEREYQYCPSLARIPMTIPFPGE